jgi:glycine oxidase
MRAIHDVIVVGGGVIGLSIARELAIQGKSVLVLDRGVPRDAASWAAAGMLAPQSEASGPDAFFHLCVASMRLYPNWVNQIREESGVDPEYAESGLLLVASTEESLCNLKRTVDWQRAAGMAAELVDPERARQIEPQLTLALTGAAHLPSERQVTPRLLLEALRGSCIARRVEIRNDHHHVEEVLSSGGRVEGVKTSRENLPARCVVIASGVGSPKILGLRPHLPVVPRKGQILSLATNGTPFRMMIRWEHAYLVPRRGGELVVGATNEEVGFDRSLTPAGIGRLLSAAQQLSSHLAGYPIRELWTGLRPAAPDGLPVIGNAGLHGLVYATGHYRNGILLAPITAVAVASILGNRVPDVPLGDCDPFRFAV